jgi:hypothetical protein
MRRLTALVLLSALAACSGASSALPTSNSSAQSLAQSRLQPAAASVAGVDVYSGWRRSMMKLALPNSGCFHASYPSYVWTPVACSTPPNVLYPLTPQLAAEIQAEAVQSVGNGNDYTIDTGSNLISEAIGSFPVVTGVTSVKSVENPEFGCCGENGKNSYTLQLNSYFFTSAACGKIKNCEGWEQFVFENPPGTGKAQLFIQDWLVPTTSAGLSGCPKDAGWEYADGGCVQNSPNSVDIPNQSIANLAEISETGEAASSGDSVYLSAGSDLYGMENVQGDGITDLSAHWAGAEFNVIGNAGGAIADFNSGASLTVSVQADDGVLSAPTCPADSGTTGESNNLKFSAPPSNPGELEYPSIQFTESYAKSGTASCDKVAGSGT